MRLLTLTILTLTINFYFKNILSEKGKLCAFVKISFWKIPGLQRLPESELLIYYMWCESIMNNTG